MISIELATRLLDERVADGDKDLQLVKELLESLYLPPTKIPDNVTCVPTGYIEVDHDEWFTSPSSVCCEAVDGWLYFPKEDWPDGCIGPGDGHHYRFFKKINT